MKKEDFIFDHKEDKYEDYWFKVTGETKEELTRRYMEMCMVEVTDVVYSKHDNAVGIKRLFPFNYDVVLSNDEDIKELLASLIKD